jgi:putative ABC transport system permease protein
MMAAVLAIAAVTAALTFRTSLEHLVNTPRQQGWNWDVLVGNPNDQSDREAQGAALLARNRLVGSYSAIAVLAGQNAGTIDLDGVTVDSALAFDPLKGSVYPPLLEGHAPRAGNEIVLATQTLHQLHKHIGQSVHVQTPTGPRTLRVVGRMIAPSVGDILTNGLGDGAWIYGPVVRQTQAQTPANPNGPPPSAFVIFAVRYAPGASPTAAFASLRRDFGRTVLRQLPAEDAVNLQSVDQLPMVFAGLVVLLGIAIVANTLITSIRVRRRDLAVLKTLGFTQREITATVAWQMTSFILAALAIGLPLGITAGRVTWELVASNINSVSPTLIPSLAIALIVPAALFIGTAIAARPAWSAARTAPAIVMRSE